MAVNTDSRSNRRQGITTNGDTAVGHCLLLEAEAQKEAVQWGSKVSTVKKKSKELSCFRQGL